MLKTQFEHGEWVEVRGKIRRGIRSDNPKINIWVRDPCIPFKAIFLGGRKLSDCEWKWEDVPSTYDGPGDGMYLEMTNSNFQNGALVCQKNRNPVKVLLSDVHKIPSPSVELCIHGSAVYVKA